MRRLFHSKSWRALEAARKPLWLLDLGGRCVYVNPALMAAVRLGWERIAGHAWVFRFSESSRRQFLPAFMDRVIRGEGGRESFETLGEDCLVTARAVARPALVGGRLWGAFGTLENVAYRVLAPVRRRPGRIIRPEAFMIPALARIKAGR